MDSNSDGIGLRATIIPDLSAVSDNAKNAWRPEIKDEALRSTLFADQSIADDLFADLLCQLDLDNPLLASHMPHPDDLEFLLGTDADAVARRAGLVRHANQLARLISTGRLDLPTHDWDIADLQFSLKLRTYSITEDVPGEDLALAIAQSGQICLSAWLNTLPSAVQHALDLSNAPLGVALRQRHISSAHADIFAACLNRMRAHS